MRHLRHVRVLAMAMGVPALAADPEISFSVDVPTRLGSTDFRGNQTVSKAAGGNVYTLGFSDAAALGSDVNIDALHVIEDGGCSPTACQELLFSVDAPLTIGGAPFYPYDVIRHTLAGGYQLEWRPAGAGAATNIDAVGRDANGNLLISFDSPTEVTGVGSIFMSADVGRVVGGTLQATKAFEGATAVTPGLGRDVNIIGVEQDRAGNLYFTFDNAVVSHGLRTIDMAVWNAASQGLSVYWSDSAFPAGSAITDFSFGPAPGSIPGDGLALAKNANGTDVDLAWEASCGGRPDATKGYRVYEGSLGTFYAHVPNPSGCVPVLTSCGSGQTCTTVTPGIGDRYYLVVERTPDFEGSYGTDSAGSERPPSAAPCDGKLQMIQACP